MKDILLKDILLISAIVGAGWLVLASCAGETVTEPNAPSVAAQDALEPNTWITRRAMPFYRTGVVTAAVPDAAGESILYVIGGSTESGACLGRVQAYHVRTNIWRSRADLPAALCGINGAGVINGKIYVAGGAPTNQSKGPSASLFVYDPGTNVWSQKRSMPEGGTGGISGVIKGKLYVVTITRSGPRFFRYNPTTDAWVRLPSTDYWWLGGGGGAINGKFYLIAQALKVYDPSTNQWTTKGRLPGDLHGSSAVLLGRLYIFGADTRTGTENWGIFVYDPVTNTWTRKPLLTNLQDSYNITGASRVFLNGEPRVEIVGGGAPGNNLQYVP